MSKQTHGDTQCYKPALPENRSVYIPVIKVKERRVLQALDTYPGTLWQDDEDVLNHTL